MRWSSRDRQGETGNERYFTINNFYFTGAPVILILFMKWNRILALLFVIISCHAFAQSSVHIQGQVKDNATLKPVIGAIVEFSQTGAVTNDDGVFELSVPVAGKQINDSLTVVVTGYKKFAQYLSLQDGETKEVVISLSTDENILNVQTISGSRFQKKLSEEIVSMEVIKPDKVLKMGINEMDEAVNRVPGVDVIDQQVNIRGGAGWSYGAGSRVLVLVDEMPMLSADAGDVKWDYLPIENCEQVEVLKGAASSLYGSSALNGVINFRTAYAKSKPVTKVMLYNGIYGNPKFRESKWWGNQQPQFQGGYFSHARKIGNLDFVLGSAWYGDDSYLQGDLTRRARANVNLRYTFKKLEGLVAGVNVNAQKSRTQTFFFWQPDSNYLENIYKPFGGLDDSTTTVNKNRGTRFNIDPYITYIGKNGWKHYLRTRFFRTENKIPEKNQSSRGDQYYGEYQVQKRITSNNIWLDNFNIVAGMVGMYNSVAGELYGAHTSSNMAPYLQLEKKFNKMWVSLGGRYEINQIDRQASESRPVFRAGLNYEAAKSTFVRASFGQGYRMPSIAERFIRTNFGASSVFPNPQLQSETGYSCEIGIKQLFRLGSWVGYADAAGFWTEYKNMMEFNFGIHLPEDSTVTTPMRYLGFKSINVGQARIYGVDLVLHAVGKIGPVNTTLLLGYTYMNPVQVNPDSVVRANLSGETNTLKYRYKHSAKGDIVMEYKGFSLGATLLYHSFMENIDEVFANTKPQQNLYGLIFELGTGLPSTITDFREQYGKKGTFVMDLRAAYTLTRQIRLGFIVKNVTNTLYEVRPALAGAPRNFTLQLMVDL
ncbi:MAG TPA: TonB-dependent receptor [Flavipsychrobacter sp.]|nr:TonB-dependent receptor [Flavipsychrobacter sp.]